MSDIAYSPVAQGTPAPSGDPHFRYVLALGDDNLVLAQRLGEWISRGPELEDDIALANFAIDHLGQARALLTHAGQLEGAGRSEDDLAMHRDERQFTNLLICELPNGHFGDTMARALCLDAYQVLLWDALSTSKDEVLGGIAQKALREARYHLRHSTTWVERLGDGTALSHDRMQASIDRVWRFTGEMFAPDPVAAAMASRSIGVDPTTLYEPWRGIVEEVLDRATLTVPEDTMHRIGGRVGFHTDDLGHMLAEMQWLARSMPEAAW
ncbi:MAG TPA: 1,2-phenylacetyl-CoA epoxidase subunit PaaC [Acidimicrobiia bacterium]|nr:1,2-phenylacetyl-CoA epoxidase subunit PaaC [Acidimicrobiia bacterium]